jgi:hypothetical protein
MRKNACAQMNHIRTFALENFSHLHSVVSRAAAGEKAHQLCFIVHGKTLRAIFKRVDTSGQRTTIFIFFAPNQPNLCHDTSLILK